MSSDTVIKVEGLSKHYILNKQAQQKNDTLYENFIHGLKNIKQITQKKETQDFWALKDVSFEIQQGDRVGIIGRNGAGKSTLLKILSRITPPTKGKIEYTGRLAALLEVGTGFHGDLSGRENIYLNGSILGMTKHEIDRKFDEIVSFSEIEKFLDTPVKRYSSGMYVRLAFSVAAHLESDILIVDEVLAVGDAAFQKKCLGKMNDISSKEGRTILFVSHQMDSIQKLCNKGVLLQKGELMLMDDIENVVQFYLDTNHSVASRFDIVLPENYNDLNGYAYQIQVEDDRNMPINEIPIGKNWQIRIKFIINKQTPQFVIACGITSMLGLAIQTSWSVPQDLEKGDYEVVFLNKEIFYTEAQYKLVVGLSTEQRVVQFNDQAGYINVSDVVSSIHDKRIINAKSSLILNQMDSSIKKIS
ncbi:MAG: ABC transporter ATP-binding protein [Bacteroidota bacterium]